MNTDFEFVYVNHDGTVRELSENEREYLSEEFAPGDGARPYIKSSYAELNGWGSMSGFLQRSMVPANVEVQPVNPQFDMLVAENARDPVEDMIAPHRATGDIIEQNPDGSISCTPNPELSADERAEILQRFYLERQLEQERLAKFPEPK
jgi:hypothetical protein